RLGGSCSPGCRAGEQQPRDNAVARVAGARPCLARGVAARHGGGRGASPGRGSVGGAAACAGSGRCRGCRDLAELAVCLVQRAEIRRHVAAGRSGRHR
ncbi:MAG: hypothetical protein EOO78_23565, partial [Oxalobacteraceae bacterium]